MLCKCKPSCAIVRGLRVSLPPPLPRAIPHVPDQPPEAFGGGSWWRAALVAHPAASMDTRQCRSRILQLP